MSRSWKELRSYANDAERETVTNQVREVFKRMPPEDRKIIEDFLVRGYLMTEVREGASDGAFRDVAANRRVAIRFLNLMDPRNEPERSSTDG